MKNILVHGFNTKDPQKTVGKLESHLDNTFLFDYGWFGLLSVLFRNKKEATKLKAKIAEFGDSIVYGHSNGAAISVEAARQGAEMELLVCINPALKVDTVFPDTIKHVLVIHTRHDKPTQAARFFDSMPFVKILAPNAWGAMGAMGYKGNDPKVINWNLTDTLEGHSDFFNRLDYLAPQLKDKIKSIISA